MSIDYIKLQESEWNTLFSVEIKSNEIIILQIALHKQLVILIIGMRLVRLTQVQELIHILLI